MKSDTLRLTMPFGRTLWLTLILLIFFSGIAEWIARLEFFQATLTPPKMGSRHYQLGHKLALLETDIKNNGPVDCIMVGSSMVDVGFDPDAFQSAYQEITGRNIHCFDFGIDASSAFSTAALARILTEDFHPRILMVGTDPRDYTLPLDDRDVVAIMDSNWIRYRLGHFTLDGWLTDNSYFYRYRQHLGRLVRFNFTDTLWSETHLTFPILPNGFTRISKVSTYINDPPNPKDTSYEVTYYSRIYSAYQMLDNNLAGLEGIMRYKEMGTQVIIVEMPVSNGLYYFFGNGKKDYQRYINEVTELSELHRVPFWRTVPLNIIPDDGWSDYSHLNIKGAELFSTWLGQQVGKAEERGTIDDLHP